MRTSKKGVSRILIAAAIVAAATIGGCFLFKQGKLNVTFNGTSLKHQRATEKDYEFIEDATVRKHFVAQANQTNYRYKTYSSAANLNYVNEIQIKGDKFNTRYIESDPKGTELKHKIDIGNTVYIKDFSDGKWWKQTKTYQEEEKIQNEVKTEEPIDLMQEYAKPNLKFRSLGKEPCGPTAAGLNCFKYEQTGGDEQDLYQPRVFWFDDNKYLLRKEESTLGEFGVKIEYAYDGINITAPSSTKDVPAGRDIYEYFYVSGETNLYMPSEMEREMIEKYQKQLPQTAL